MTIDFIYQRHISGCNKVSDKVKSQKRTVQSLNNSCLVSHGKLKRIFIYEEKKTVLFSFHMALIMPFTSYPVALMAVFNLASSTGPSEMITVSPLLWEEVTLST